MNQFMKMFVFFFGKNLKISSNSQIKKVESRHTRTLVCPTSSPQKRKLSTKPIDCYPITIFHYKELGYYDTIQLQLLFTDPRSERRLSTLFNKGILYPQVRIEYTFVNNQYSLLSGALRSILVLLTTVCFFTYVIVCSAIAGIRRANLKAEQKAFILAFFFLVCFFFAIFSKFRSFF